MKKKKDHINDPVTIDKLDAMEHEKLDETNINITPKKKIAPEMVLLVLTIVLKITQYLLLLLPDEKIRIVIFIGLAFITLSLLLLARLYRPKWAVSKLVAAIDLVLIIMDIAVIFYLIR